MFKRISQQDTFTFTFDGTEITACAGDSVAAALLANGISNFRKTHVSASNRGPYCMMGACYDCLVEVDGCTVQSCMTQAVPDLCVQRARSIND